MTVALTRACCSQAVRAAQAAVVEERAEQVSPAPHTMNFKAVFGTHLVTKHPRIWRRRNFEFRPEVQAKLDVAVADHVAESNF